MKFYKKYDNGLRLVIVDMPGYASVACGITVKTGSINETEEDNGISHFIEHTMFKGTTTRSSFDISNEIDRIGAQINAFTAKERTCYYTKSTYDHVAECLEILSDIFFNSVFDEKELDKEKGVIIEEINMCEDSPEDICFDLLAESCYGKLGLGATILGPAENIKRFTKADVKKYMDKYYTAENVVISIAGKVDIKKVEELVDNLFADKFAVSKGAEQFISKQVSPQSLFRNKKLEQTHLALAMPALPVSDKRVDALRIASEIFGGGMSSRLFQKIREEEGLAYSVYSTVGSYKDSGVIDVYAGVNTNNRDKAVEHIINEIRRIKVDKITESEFLRGKEQIKSSFIMSRESTVSQMFSYARTLIFLNEEFDFKKQILQIDGITYSDVLDIIDEIFDINKASFATIGPKRSAIKIN